MSLMHATRRRRPRVILAVYVAVVACLTTDAPHSFTFVVRHFVTLCCSFILVRPSKLPLVLAVVVLLADWWCYDIAFIQPFPCLFCYRDTDSCYFRHQWLLLAPMTSHRRRCDCAVQLFWWYQCLHHCPWLSCVPIHTDYSVRLLYSYMWRGMFVDPTTLPEGVLPVRTGITCCCLFWWPDGVIRRGDIPSVFTWWPYSLHYSNAVTVNVFCVCVVPRVTTTPVTRHLPVRSTVCCYVRIRGWCVLTIWYGDNLLATAFDKTYLPTIRVFFIGLCHRDTYCRCRDAVRPWHRD